MRQVWLLLLFVILILEQLIIRRWFKHHQAAHGAISIMAVLGWSYPVIVEEYGSYDKKIWRIVGTGVAAAGLVQMGLSMLETNRANKQRRVFRG